MDTTQQIAKKLVTLCQQDKSRDAVEMLYAPNVVSVEATGGGDMPQRQEGIDAIRKKHDWWYANHEIHGGKVTGPWPHGDRFIVQFQYEVTPKAGPMAGKRMKIDEAGLYTVQNGKIVKEEFFYDMNP